MSSKYTYAGITSLDININYGSIVIEESMDDITSLEIKCSDEQLKNFKIEKIGGELKVSQKPTGGSINIINNDVSSIFGNGMTITQSGATFNFSGGVGEITINGKKINLSEFEEGEEYSTPVITIKCPKVDCSIELSNAAELVSESTLAEVEVELSGSSKVKLYQCDNLDADLSGSSSLEVKMYEGDLDADTSGCASIKASGNFNSVKADASGTSSISTVGTVIGTYKASASDCAKIRHKGTIKGKVKESTSGMASISLDQL